MKQKKLSLILKIIKFHLENVISLQLVNFRIWIKLQKILNYITFKRKTIFLFYD